MGWAAASVAAAVAGGAAWSVRGRASNILGPSRWRGDPQRRTIALTFDDGPSESTPELLRVLEQYSIPATFFQCGAHIRRLPDIARAVAKVHEVGNHTDTHPRLWLRSPEFIRREVSAAQVTAATVCSQTPRWFRAPYGVRWPGLASALQAESLVNVMWTVIGLDWKREANQIATRVLERVGNGGIICLHDGRGMQHHPGISSTMEAVRRIIPQLLDRGYAFETVTQILCPKT